MVSFCSPLGRACLVGFLLLGIVTRAAPTTPAPRERIRIDADWRFALGHATDPARDFDHGTGFFSWLAKTGYGDGPAAPTFDDRAWRRLDLPHDWAVEAPFDPRASSSHGFKAVGRLFPERSIGWYRHHFPVPAGDLGRRIALEFDGVYRDAQVWVNGFFVGRQPSGYLGARYDITDYLNYGAENVVAVRVDATVEEGWFYEGAGIYRHVWLTKTAPLHVAPCGVAVTTEAEGRAATIQVRTEVANESDHAATFAVQQEVLSPAGEVVATSAQRDLTLAAGTGGEYPAALSVADPRLWSVDSPALYRLVTTIVSNGAVLDRLETAFGIRTIRFDPNEGFFLNGRRVELKGVNLHQDHAGLGVALPDAMQTYRLQRLKEFGVNAYRSSHNPPTPELLDACDRLGILVIDENRLMGSNPEHLDAVTALIRRDRNHPSVILWSLGNEEWAVEGNVTGARIARTMQSHARRLDPSRQNTVAISGGWGAGISTVIGVMGYNYYTHGDTDKQHAQFPWQSSVGTEETTMQETRGVYFADAARAHQGPQENGSSGGNLIKGWQHFVARPYLAGPFFWTGLDYRGEPTPFGYPAISSQFGILDTCGFPKDSAYYLKAWWTEEPVLHLFPSWNLPGHEGQEISVTCYSNHDEVELLRNGRSLGRQAMPRNGVLTWKVAYEPGALEARGYRAGKLVATTRNETLGTATTLELTPDRASVRADGDDVVVFTVAARDAQGRLVTDAANRVRFAVTGGRILGVGNGDPGCLEPDTFVEQITLVPIDSWRGQLVPSGMAGAVDEGKSVPLAQLGNWLAPRPKTGDTYVLDAVLTTDALPPNATLTLFLPSLGRTTDVTLDGTTHRFDTNATGPELRLEASQLPPGKHRLRLIVTPFVDGKNHIPELNRLGTLRIATPAPQPERSLFSGYAQVIVQPTGTPGGIRLEAAAAGLSGASIQVPAK